MDGLVLEVEAVAALTVIMEKSVVPWARRHVRPTFAGDPGAALSLACALPNEDRGVVAVRLWESRVDPLAFRAFIESVWVMDHARLIDAARTRRRLAEMFDYAAFPLPDEMPDTLRVYRGARGVSVERAAAGFSWTTDFDVACWFAMRFERGDPLVIAADIKKGDVSFSTNERNEAEVVITKRIKRVEVAGSPDRWRERHEARSFF